MDETSGTDPLATDEPTVLVKVYGWNEASVAAIHGWTHFFPLHFPGLQHPNRMRSIRLEDFNSNHKDSVVQKARREYNDRTTLAELVGKTPLHKKNGVKLLASILVTVVAKKQLEVVSMSTDSMLISFGQLLVADESGVGIIKLINTGITVFYNQVEIGDCLLICDGTLINPQTQNYYSAFGEEKYCLPLVIKITDFNTRHVYKFESHVERNTMPSFMLNETKLWTPSALLATSMGGSNNCEKTDVIGVISHVSRMERYRKYTSKVRLHDGKEDDFVQFNVLCWIEIVDKNSSPIPIKLFMNSLLWEKQSELVPGSVIVITNIEFGYTDFQHEHLSTSAFSQIYINAKISQYLSFMRGSQSIQDEAKKLIGINESKDILKRNDVTWSLGGHYVLPINGDINFVVKNYRRSVDLNGVTWTKLPVLPLFRRESQFLSFKGKILRYNLIKTDWDCEFNSWTWANANAFESLKPKPRTIKTIYDPIPVHTRDTSLWYMFRRRLPTINLEGLSIYDSSNEEFRNTSIYEHVSKSREKYMPSLLMPAGVGKELKKLEVIDGTPHYAVDIYNCEGKETLRRHIMTWKPSRNLSIEQMKRKLELLGAKEEVMFLATVHRAESIGLEEKYGHEFILHDITEVGPFSNINGNIRAYL